MPTQSNRSASTDATQLDESTRESIACEADDLVIAAETLHTCDENGITVASARLMVRTIERSLAEVKHLIDTRDRAAGS